MAVINRVIIGNCIEWIVPNGPYHSWLLGRKSIKLLSYLDKQKRLLRSGRIIIIRGLQLLIHREQFNYLARVRN